MQHKNIIMNLNDWGCIYFISYYLIHFQGSVGNISNESITIKGRQFFILKMIGRGGSSKVMFH